MVDAPDPSGAGGADGTGEAMLVDWMSNDVTAAPQARYRELIAMCPVHTGGPPPMLPGESTRMVSVVSREAVDHVLRDPETFSSHGAVSLGNADPLIPLEIDPPHHLRYRKLLDPIFAPRKVAEWESEITALVNDLIDRFIGDGEADLVGTLCEPMPSTVFLNLLGLPFDNVSEFMKLKDGIIRPPGDAAAQEARRIEAGLQIYQLFEGVLADRAKQPRDDLVSWFLTAESEGERLTHEEIMGICFLFLIAGLDTVTSQLSTSFAFLAEHPEFRREIVDDPSVIPSAIEELLRWQTIVSSVARRATRDVDLHGVSVNAGDFVSVMIGAANVDDREFDDPLTVDFRRDPNRHLAFGGGIHRCLGSHLARLELRVVAREFHRRIPDYSVTTGRTIEYALGSPLRTVERLPITFPPGVAEGGAAGVAR